MRFEPLGDRAYILRELGAPAYLVANWLNVNRPAGLIEAVASYDTVGLYASSELDPASIQMPENYEATESRRHQIPVCYELGEDIQEAAGRLQISPLQLAELHCAHVYTCYAVGFCPGFAYLGHLPDALSGLARLATPRTRVEVGSVGLTGSQTAVYPLPRPGGWMLIGRTPLTLVDVSDEYFPIQAGDSVQFVSIGVEEFEARQGERL